MSYEGKDPFKGAHTFSDRKKEGMKKKKCDYKQKYSSVSLQPNPGMKQNIEDLSRPIPFCH